MADSIGRGDKKSNSLAYSQLLNDLKKPRKDTIESFDDLIYELKLYDDDKSGRTAPQIFFNHEPDFGRRKGLWPTIEISTLITIAAKSHVFESKNLKILSSYTDNFERFVQKLSYATGDDLMVPNGKSAVSRLITAIQCLHRHGPIDNDPNMAMLRGIAKTAEEIWTQDMPRKVFMAELSKRCGPGGRQMYRHFKKMKGLQDFKAYPWLYAVRSASTRRISNRKKIAKNNNED